MGKNKDSIKEEYLEGFKKRHRVNYFNSISFKIMTLVASMLIVLACIVVTLIESQRYGKSFEIGFVIGTIIVCLAASYFFAQLIIRPIVQISDIISDTAEFDLTHNPNSDKLVKRKDETGYMAKSTQKMRAALRDIVSNITEAGDSISSNVINLQDVTSVVNSVSTDNSATTEELAAGMQETAATTETVNADVITVTQTATDILKLSESGDAVSNEVKERAENLKVRTMEATKRTQDTYDSVKVRSAEAIEESKAVDRINELTDTIMSISSQTSLLALNASIEAARAGEAGRGFAVVASEIGSLADQTSQAVGNINSMVLEVTAAVNNMTKCLEETTDFLETTVLADYAEFAEVSEQYSEDASTFKNTMNDVNSAITELNSAIDHISVAMSGINSTVSEATIGITDIADKTSDMVEKTSATNDLVEESLTSVEQLRSIVNEFTIG